MTWLAPLRIWWRLTVIEFRGFVGLGRGIARRPDIPTGTMYPHLLRRGELLIRKHPSGDVAAQVRVWAGVDARPPASAADR